ncbi:MAG TPA: VOC family protein [Pseudonocardiaceae bacterium]|jgi:catechol 2,3-dioxygenase-like lactoylglutathione lyase family enzyme|nr:VOC family protein [Pseudonocardiaceae bacterium]
MAHLERPVLDDIHHVKMLVSDLAEGLLWWERAFGAQRQERLDHFTPEGELFGYIMSVPGITPPLELTLVPDGSLDGAFGPVALAVESRDDLDRWVAWFDEVGIDHSTVLRGLGSWVLVVRDPDGTPVRIYCRETHEWDAAGAAFDSPWL